MIYNSILVQLNIDEPSGPRVKYAWDLAQRFEADLIGFAACEPQPVILDANGMVVDGEIMSARIEEIENRLKVVKEEFEAQTAESNRASWRGFIGNPTGLLAKHCRAADLIVAGPPGDGVAHDPHRTVDVGTLILSAGRPILLANENLALVRADNILVAWKDSREARRAVVDAMPFLVHARDVLVATVEGDDRKKARDSIADVVRFLMKHGVKARSEVVEAGSAPDGEALAELAHRAGADLVIAGGYGHSRLREWAFGGVTRSLLQNGSFNRLMSN